MRIAVNTRFLKDQPEGYGYFTREIFFLLAVQHPADQFFFFFDRPYNTALQFPANATPVVIAPKVQNALSQRWWLNVKVPFALRRHKIDVFVSPGGACSLATKVPQVLVVHDLAFIHHPKLFPKLQLLLYKNNTPKYIKKAGIVVTVSEFSRHDIIQQYNVPVVKVVNVSGAARPAFKPIDWEEKEQVKEKYAEGCEYFVFVGGLNPRKNLLNLLKAVSLFKKRQHTNMKLLVVGNMGGNQGDTLEKLETFKFRNAIKMHGYLPEAELVKVVGSAYALIFPGFFEGFGLPIVEAMQSGVPVITSCTSSMPEVGGDAAMYADPNNPSAIADQMKLIYKDENLRSSLVKKGLVWAEKYSWEKSAALMWGAIQQAVSQ